MKNRCMYIAEKNESMSVKRLTPMVCTVRKTTMKLKY